MNLVANVLAGILLVACAFTALVDFTQKEKAYEMTRPLRIPDNAVPVLGAIKAAAAIGLGLSFSSVGMAKLVGVCLCIYFAVATATHTRVKDTVARTAPAFILTAMSVLFVLTTFAK
jgi:uncharacterized iron-regulated membrane protein